MAAVSHGHPDSAVPQELDFFRQPVPRVGRLSPPGARQNSPLDQRQDFFGGGLFSGSRNWIVLLLVR